MFFILSTFFTMAVPFKQVAEDMYPPSFSFRRQQIGSYALRE